MIFHFRLNFLLFFVIFEWHKLNECLQFFFSFLFLFFILIAAEKKYKICMLSVVIDYET